MTIIKRILQSVYKLYYVLIFSALFLLLYPFFLIGFFIIKNQYFIYQLHVIWAKCLNFLTFISLDIKNPISNLPKGPYVIISNHTSFLDVFLMCLIFPKTPLVFMAKSELLSIPLFRTLFKYYHIPVYRKNRKKAAYSIIQSEKKLDEGLSVVLFPEGGIIDGYAPRLAPFKNGAFKLAKDKGVAIIPLTYIGNYQLIDEPTKLFSTARPGRARVVIHPIITAKEVGSLSQKELRDKCFEIIEKPLKDEYNY